MEAKEIILVEVIDGEELESYARAFTDLHDAEEYFVKELKERFEDENNPFTDYDIVDILDDGFYADDTHFSMIIKEIPLNIKD